VCGHHDPAIREALQPLLALRREQAGARYRECVDAKAYQAKDDKRSFLARQGAPTSGPVEPEHFPYYVLLIGGPDAIPFRFQYQLDVQYAVGRLCFDTKEEYASYARSVVAAELGLVKLPRTIALAGVRNEDDRATKLSSEQLIAPLSQQLQERAAPKGWQVTTLLADQATKNGLRTIVGGGETPAVLFTASHGVEFRNGHPLQAAHQGALLAQEWPGPLRSAGKLAPEMYLSADDLGDDVQLAGTIAFHFACFGAGTPQFDDFPHLKRNSPLAQLAERSFIARLPQRMLSHPAGGALAVIGHVERAWGYSISGSGGANDSQTKTFLSTLEAMMLNDKPVGAALEYFNGRYAELATVLTDSIYEARVGAVPDVWTLTREWTEHNDARSYVVLGDPAVRLSLAAQSTSVVRPELVRGPCQRA
ncbi:hypothetical protein HC891_19635, partial [Candidatus Gracilibacteria bacterium]|nr:hypothetical protein [Candidatus Gracilibacteria bacterium]